MIRRLLIAALAVFAVGCDSSGNCYCHVTVAADAPAYTIKCSSESTFQTHFDGCVLVKPLATVAKGQTFQANTEDAYVGKVVYIQVLTPSGWGWVNSAQLKPLQCPVTC